MSGIFDPDKKLDAACQENIRKNASSAALRIIAFYFMVVICNVCHHLLKPWSQPRITSDIVIGLAIGNITPLKRWLVSIPEALDTFIDFGMVCYMFALGLEMDPYVLFKRPTRAIKVAYAGMISTFILCSAVTPFLKFFTYNSVLRIISLSIVLSGTTSPVLTRLITSHKIGKSDIGQLVIAAGMHSDFVSTLVLCILIIIPQTREHPSADILDLVASFSGILVQSAFAAVVAPFFLNWVNNENPEGKPMKGSHLVLSVALMVALCCCSLAFRYSITYGAFMAGIFLPREGRVSKWTLGKINYFLYSIFYPIFFFWMGYESYFGEFESGKIMTWVRMVIIFAITTGGKVVGTVIAGAFMGFNWPESVMVGLLLATKGHFHIFLAIIAKKRARITTSTCIMMVIVHFFTVVYTPAIVARIIKRARRRAPTHRMALEWLDPLSELRMLVCIKGPEQVASTINLMETSRGAADPGIVVYVTDIIELTDELAATLVPGDGDSLTLTDKAVIDMREQISSAVQAYVEENGDGMTLRRMLALSTFNLMPRDICNLAEDLMISIIILPFHKCLRADGSFDSGHLGFRFVNRKVLKNAPCSVGILVDRGFGSHKMSGSFVSVNVAVIFIGGRDDREALSYASRVSRHPGVKLTVIRFLVESADETSARRAHNYRINIAEQEEEMKLDDECFANFYEKHVAGGPVAYMEKHLANSAETFSTLKSFQDQYSLIIVGRGGRVNSILTVGMNDLEQCPELGPVGDVLSGSNFSVTTSVLVIQQFNPRGELEGLDEDFSIM